MITGSEASSVHLRVAEAAAAVRRYSLVEIEARKALAADPDSFEGRYWLAVALAEQDRLAEARMEVMAALRVEPNDSLILRLLATIQYREGQLRECESTIRSILQSEPDSVVTLRMLAEILHERGRLTESTEAAHAGLALDPHAPDLYGALSFTLTKLGRFREAQEAAVRGLQLAPEDPLLQNNYGLAVALGGDPVAARDLYLEAARLNPMMKSAVGNIEHMRSWEGDGTAEFRKRATMSSRLQAAMWWWQRRAAHVRLGVLAATFGIGFVSPIAWMILADCLHLEIASQAYVRFLRPWHGQTRRRIGAILALNATVAVAWSVAIAGSLWFHGSAAGFGIASGVLVTLPLAYCVASEGKVRVRAAVMVTAMLTVAIAGDVVHAGGLTSWIQIALLVLLALAATQFDRLTAVSREHGSAPFADAP